MAADSTQGIGMTSQRTRDRLVERLKQHGIAHPEVLEQIRHVPRHLFIDEALAHRAYEDTALPIGHGQTISQPFIVALMTELLVSTPRGRVLEIGTGCGYQTAILAGLVNTLWSVERLGALTERARRNLRRLGIKNVRQRTGDGYEGWRINGPYDGILVTAAAPQIPAALLEQLAEGGRLVIPEGDVEQRLVVIDKIDGEIRRSERDYVRFVPMLGGVVSGGASPRGALERT